jgi:hypothetical protein
VSAIEIPAAHLLLPWRTARSVMLGIGVYALLWMVGMVASLRVHPHVVGDRGLRLRRGITLDVTIPWEVVAAVETRTRSLPSSRGVQ